MVPAAVRERALASYLGLAIGDALGATTEFMTPQEIRSAYGVHNELRGGGWLHIKPGRVTDDTQMAMALGDSIIEKGKVEPKAAADAFIGWMRSKPPDIGGTVRRGLQRYIVNGTTEAEPSEQAAGNGAAMRNLPVALAALNDDELFRDWSMAQAHVTHNNRLSDGGTVLLCDMARQAVVNGQTAPLHSIARMWIALYPEFEYKKFKTSDSDGYIVHTARVVLNFFFNTLDFESCLTGVVNIGGDADTNAALAGQIAGAFYGLDSIPSRWLKKLDPAVRDRIEKQVDGLLEISARQSMSTTSDI
ncbi:MAG: ADP-ribosyl-[dinitrogen reductase] hydrolase [Nitrospinae bacterium]|nr:ADP-ribosyl-[dinitrogen reductase] hydrolase [Nitrospinota bacterium]